MTNKDMFHRFPDLAENAGSDDKICFDNVPYAFYSSAQQSGRKTVFMTENTVFFILNGTKYLYLDKETIEIDKHNFVLIKRGVYTMSEYIPDGESFQIIHFFIPDRYFSKISADEGEPATSSHLPFVSLKNTVLTEAFIKQFRLFFNRQQMDGLKNLVELKFQELLLLMNASAEKRQLQSFIRSLPHNSSVDIGFITNEYLFKPVTVDELAKLSGRSTASFKRDFESQFNTSPRRWINQERLKQARSLLLQTNKTVAEVAYECGYTNVSHFIQIFKTQYGETPAQSRAKRDMI